MWTIPFRSATRAACCGALALAAASLAGCSPSRLPGTPSPILAAGGGGRYNGTITVRRLGGAYTITETTQSLVLSLVVRDADQITGRFEAGESTGTIQGRLTGNLAGGSMQATTLISTVARQAAGTVTCEGRGEVTATLAGANLTWTTGTIAYDNCPGLTATSQAQAVAVSPIPGGSVTRAMVVIGLPGGTIVPRGTCLGGSPGYPFAVEITETKGVRVTFDETFQVEERRNFGAVSTSQLDMPFRDLSGGGRRTYQACSPQAGTYQAFFSGTDANNNRFRVATPIVTLGP